MPYPRISPHFPPVFPRFSPFFPVFSRFSPFSPFFPFFPFFRGPKKTWRLRGGRLPRPERRLRFCLTASLLEGKPCLLVGLAMVEASKAHPYVPLYRNKAVTEPRR